MGFKIKVASLSFLALLLIYASALLPLVIGWLVNNSGTLGIIALPPIVIVWGLAWAWLAFTGYKLFNKKITK